jgi:hypothetical protein
VLTASFVGTAARTRRVHFTARPSVAGTLVDEQARPIGGAALAVSARAHRAGAKALPLPGVTTQADGSFAYELPPGPSRTLAFSYTAFSGDATPASQSVLHTRVRAAVSARARPRSPRAGHRFRLTGRLRRLPRARVQVNVQLRDGREWRTVDHVKTRAGGRYAWRHRFERSSAGRRFVFRAQVDSPIYPFVPGHSRPVRLLVRP